MFELTPERIWILIAGAILILAILFFGRPRKPGQGRRVARGGEEPGPGRVEPTLGEQLEVGLAEGEPAAPVEGTQEGLFGDEERALDELGKRPSDAFDKIVTVYLAARAGEKLRGPDSVRSEEHTSELQSRENLVCRILLDKKNATARQNRNEELH